MQLIKRFGPVDKPMPICLVILSGTQAKEIYELSELFYLKITVEAYKKNRPLSVPFLPTFRPRFEQLWQRSSVKCAGAHTTISCTKTRDQPPTCANCNGAAHTRPTFVAVRLMLKSLRTSPKIQLPRSN